MLYRRELKDNNDDIDYMLDFLTKLDNGFQIFYDCLKETQHSCPKHKLAADILKYKGRFTPSYSLACAVFLLLSLLIVQQHPSLMKSIANYQFIQKRFIFTKEKSPSLFGMRLVSVYHSQKQIVKRMLSYQLKL